jgi:hypothetical protein
MRKRTSKARRYRHQVKVLKSEVMSPRIAWFNFLGFLRSLSKVAVVVGLLIAAAYGIRQAIEHTFHRNPDFQLKAINLNTNDVLDEADLVTLLNINLTGNIFDFDVKELEMKLMEQPAISSARVERNLPGTLDFRIITRKPAAWIGCPEEGFPIARAEGALLVDHDGFAYLCPSGQAALSQELPIIELSKDAEHPIRSGQTLVHPQYSHSLRLLKAVISRHPGELPMINSISQANEWSLNLTTRAGTVATFGLGDHKRQMEYLGTALDHAQKKGYEIETINLIPRRNVPITVSGETEPPRAIPVLEEDTVVVPAQRQSDDLRTLLNRN